MAPDTAIGDPGGRRGFTLLELIVVLAIMGILLAAAMLAYDRSLERAREKVLRQNLATMRDAIDAYSRERDGYPYSLEQLVTNGYLPEVPEDPMIGSADRWVTEQGLAPDGTRGVWDVHSSAGERGSDGVPYSEW